MFCWYVLIKDISNHIYYNSKSFIHRLRVIINLNGWFVQHGCNPAAFRLYNILVSKKKSIALRIDEDSLTRVSKRQTLSWQRNHIVNIHDYKLSVQNHIWFKCLNWIILAIWSEKSPWQICWHYVRFLNTKIFKYGTSEFRDDEDKYWYVNDRGFTDCLLISSKHWRNNNIAIIRITPNTKFQGKNWLNEFSREK